MTEEEKTAGNNLIQEFMGWKLEFSVSSITGNKIYWFARYNKNGEKIDEDHGGDSWNWNENSTMPYHRNHNLLISVVEEIEKGNYGFKMCRKVVEVYLDDTKEIIIRTKEDCRLNSLYKAVVDFLKWQNKGK